MNIFLVGQKWLASSVYEKLKKTNIVGVSTPNTEDGLYWAAVRDGINATTHKKQLLPEHIPANTDLIVCAHAHCFVTPEAINKTRLGAIGYHPSLLPLHRGRDAIRWAIHMRERITGGTVYWLDKGIDAGDIEAQDFCFIRADDTPLSLWKRELAPMGVNLLIESINHIEAGNSQRKKQDENIATWEPSFNQRKLSPH